MAELVNFEAARWAKWKAQAARRAQQRGVSVEEEVANGLRLRAWLRSIGHKWAWSAPFACEREDGPMTLPPQEETS